MMSGALIGLIAASILIGCNCFVACRMVQRRVGIVGWSMVLLLLAGGVVLGIRAGFYLEYHVNPTTKIAGAPIPVAIFQLETVDDQQRWTDFVVPFPMLVACTNVLRISGTVFAASGGVILLTTSSSNLKTGG